MKRILVIDGNYFAHRTLGAINMGDSVNNLESKTEQNNFTAALNSSLISLCTTFQPFCQQFIFCFDNKSWRKEIKPYKPYWVDDDRPLDYKENRKEKKEESSINYDNFNLLLEEFTENLKTKMIVFDVQGLEGDDVMMLLSSKFANDKNHELIVFANDGDLEQIVKNNCMLFRNIKSKDAPYGEFVLSYNKFCEIFESKIDVKIAFLQPSNNISFYKGLFRMSLNGNFEVKRSLNEGISVATPFKIALLKSITGDKKDNLLSVIGWKKNDKYYKVTEKMIDKSLSVLGLKLTESTCCELFKDSDMMITLINNLKNDTNQQTIVSTSKILEHLKHNLRMNVLSINNIPKQYVEDFETCFKGYEDTIYNGIFDSKLVFQNLNVTKKDNATNLMSSSIPTQL